MIPFPNVPGVPGWIMDQLGDLGDSLNPFVWFANAIRGVYSLLAWYFEFVIAHPPRFNDRQIEDYLYGNAIGFAGLLISVVTFALLCWSVVQIKKVITLAEAIVIGILVTAGAPVVYSIIDSMIQLGDVLSVQAMFSQNAPVEGDNLIGFAISASLNPLLLMAALVPTTIFGSLCMLVVFIYELLIILLKIIFLPALALRVIGPRFRAFSDWTISAAVIAMILGRPIMILCIEIGNWAGSRLLGGTVASLVFFIVAGMCAGIVVQYVMFKQVQKVVAKVSGNTNSRVFGKVQTEQKPDKVNSQNARDRYASTLNHRDTHASSRVGRTVHAGTSYVHHETKRAVSQKVASSAAAAVTAATAAGTAGSTTVALAAIATAAESSARRSQTRRDRP